MNTARTTLLLFCVLALLTAACGGGDEPEPVVSATPTVTAVPVPAFTPTPTPTPTPSEGGPTYPLTGEEVTDETRLTLPALGVKVDNAPQARPQLGLQDADVVFEELVEGGVTRFLAIFHSTDPGEVGPVRSGRDVDADLFPPFDGILAISGAAAPTYNVLFSAGLTVFEEGQAGGAIHRVADRSAPHNLNATATQLWDAGDEQPAATEPWPFDATPPTGGEPVTTILAPFSDDYSHSWAWREAEGVFERGQNGTRHLTADGSQIAAANIVYAEVETGSGGGVDVSGSATVSIELIGGGEATFYRDGQRFEGTWRKTARDAQFEWLDARGQPFPLAPGATWVELQPAGLGQQVDVADVSADAPTEEPTE
ncbi:DUF3048 domain-containing protein [Euzebya rosea]|uniref:DUF3048 domain-containing protein n=1 Tax=Euzebya rosea TaxID=2052804 RepID=UPI000D3ED959|nr:DUF3048 domain-containing protein [Euzebya rosea]